MIGQLYWVCVFGVTDKLGWLSVFNVFSTELFIPSSIFKNHTFLVTKVTIDEKREIREQIFDQLGVLKSKIPFDFDCIVAAMMRQRIEIGN